MHGHFTVDVEIIRDLVSLVHNVTCYVLDEFSDRMKDIQAKTIVYKIDRSDFLIIYPPDKFLQVQVILLFFKGHMMQYSIYY